MNDLIYDYITAGVDMLISAVILSGVVLLLRGTVILNQYSANQQATAEKVTYYKEFSIYDNTNNLSSADVISALVYYKDELDVVISLNASCTDLVYYDKINKVYVHNNAGAISKSASEDVMKGWVNSTLTFKGQIIEDGGSKPAKPRYYQGGAITGLYFTKK